MKKVIIVVTLILIGITACFKLNIFSKKDSKLFIDKEGTKYFSKVDSKYFYVYKDNKWNKEFIKGVNIGAGNPGTFPGEFGTSKEDYKRWFKYITDMNANAIRVYTILKPEFYEALYEYNESAKEPLYFFQGVWINEEDISTIKNGYDDKIIGTFKEDASTLVDIIHGKKILPKKPGHAGGVYDKDVSNYVLGWIEGIEWNPQFVNNTNDKNKEKVNYEGKYLYTEGASPFEAFLCQVGDYTIDYEMKNYNMQRTWSFNNWPTTDMLAHPNEPEKDQDIATVNIEHIKRKESFKSGIFASYHIYPYYPDFMNYQKEYVDFKNSDGKIDPYRAYLKDLREKHTMPVLVAEFGIPSARGMAHENIHTGFNQGFVNETTQGEMDVSLLKSIFEEGYAGGLVFTWQDEWFKRTWNTMDLDMPDRRAYWSNPQTNEQQFGVLAFDPGKEKSVSYVDGDISEWNNDTAIYKDNNLSLSVKSDEKYLYFMVNALNFNFDKDTLLIPIDSIPNQGNSSSKDYKVSFNKDADFIIAINGKEKSRIMVDAYYDVFYYTYSKTLEMEKPNEAFEIKNSKIFNPIYLCLNKELFLPKDKTIIPFSKYETGKLLYGNSNPESKDFNSLTDFIEKDGKIEIRIPWQLLNIMDPSTKMAMNDLYISGIKPIKINDIYLGARIIKPEEAAQEVQMNAYSWEQWDMPTYHERLKSSYYILKKAFENIKLK